MNALLDALTDRRLQAIAERWWQCRNGAVVPYWPHMPREVLKPAMPAVLLARRAPQEGALRIQTLTPDLKGLTRLKLDGKRITDVLPPNMAADVNERLLSVLDGPTAIVVKVADGANPARGAVEERLLLPLRGSGRGAPDMLMATFVRLDPNAAGWLPITQTQLAITRFPVATLAAPTRV